MIDRSKGPQVIDQDITISPGARPLEMPTWSVVEAPPPIPTFTESSFGVVRPALGGAPTSRPGFPERIAIDPTAIMEALDKLRLAPDALAGTLGLLPGVRGIGDAAGEVGRVVEQVPVLGGVGGFASDALKNTVEGIFSRAGDVLGEVGHTFNSDNPDAFKLLDAPFRIAGAAVLGKTGAKAFDFGKPIDYEDILKDAPQDILNSLAVASIIPIGKAFSMAAGAGLGKTSAAEFGKGLLSPMEKQAFSSVAEQYGRFAGRATLGVYGAGSAIEAVVPKVAGDEWWAKEIMENRLIPEDSKWRFPFDLAASLPLDVVALTRYVGASKLSAYVAKKTVGYADSPVYSYLPHWDRLKNTGIVSDEALSYGHTKMYRDAAANKVIDQYNDSLVNAIDRKPGEPVTLGSKLHDGEWHHLPYTQEQFDALVQDALPSVTREDALRATRGWGGADADETARAMLLQRFYDEARPIETSLRGKILTVNDMEKAAHAASAVAHLDTITEWGPKQHERFKIEFPSLADALKDSYLTNKNEWRDYVKTFIDGEALPEIEVLAERTAAPMAAPPPPRAAQPKAPTTATPSVMKPIGSYQTGNYNEALVWANIDKYTPPSVDRDFLRAITVGLDNHSSVPGKGTVVLVDGSTDVLNPLARRPDQTGSLLTASGQLDWRLVREVVDDRGRVLWRKGGAARAGRTIDKSYFDALKDSRGFLDLGAASDKLASEIKEELARGNKVTLFADNGRKKVDIVTVNRGMMADAAGQRWGTMELASGGAKIVVEAGAPSPAAPAATTLAAPPPTPPAARVPPPARLGALTARLYDLNERILSGDNLLIKERDAVRAEISALRNQVTEGIQNELKIAHADLDMRRGDLLMAKDDTQRLAISAAIDAAEKKVSELTQRYYEAWTAGSRWRIDQQPSGPVMKLVDDVHAQAPMERRRALGRAFDRLFGPVKNMELGKEAHEFLKQAGVKAGLKPEDMDNFFLALNEHVERTEQRLWFGMVRSPYASVWHLEPHIINNIASGTGKKAGVLGNVQPVGYKSWAEVIFRAYPGPLKIASKQIFGKALDIPYNEAFHAVTRSYYPMFRFFMDPRFLFMNIYESKVIETVLGRKLVKEEAQSWQRMRKLAQMIDESMERTGAIERSGTPEQIVRVAMSKREGEVVSAVLDFIQRHPAMERVMRDNGITSKTQFVAFLDEVMEKRAKAIAGISAKTSEERVLKGQIDELKKKAEKSPPKEMGEAENLKSEIDRLEKELTDKIVEREVHEEALKQGVSSELQPFINLLTETEKKVVEGVKRSFKGNPDRTTIERLLNSFLLYWPISYQLKAGKLLFDFMFSKGFGFQTGSAGAQVWLEARAWHENQLAEDPEYRAHFAKNKDLLFLVENLLPITPEGLGVSLSPLVRAPLRSMRGESPDKIWESITNIGPLYTYKLGKEIVREQTKRGGFLHDLFSDEE